MLLKLANQIISISLCTLIHSYSDNSTSTSSNQTAGCSYKLSGFLDHHTESVVEEYTTKITNKTLNLLTSVKIIASKRLNGKSR